MGGAGWGGEGKDGEVRGERRGNHNNNNSSDDTVADITDHAERIGQRILFKISTIIIKHKITDIHFLAFRWR